MHDDHDPLDELFRPLREQPEPTDYELDRVRAAAGRRRADARSHGHRRLVAAGVASAAVAVVAVAGVTAVDRSRPGTFVGEASAREVLLAAADAARDEPALGGWRWSTNETVDRRRYEGRRCASCPTEQAVLETSSHEELWSGPRGEAFQTWSAGPARAIENEPLLRAVGALDPPVQRRKDGASGTHVLPAPADERNVPSAFVPVSSSLAAPEAVPEEPAALVRWAAAFVAEQDQGWEQQARASKQGGRLRSLYTVPTRITYTLVDLALSSQLSGTQKAAALQALADRPQVTAVNPPPPFASPDRVAVRIAATAEDGVGPKEGQDRVVVFDRTTHRVVAEERRWSGPHPQMRMQFSGHTLKVVPGGPGETRYGAPVAVEGPGMDAEGRQRMDVAAATEIRRDGTLSDAATRSLQRR